MTFATTGTHCIHQKRHSHVHPIPWWVACGHLAFPRLWCNPSQHFKLQNQTPSCFFILCPTTDAQKCRFSVIGFLSAGINFKRTNQANTSPRFVPHTRLTYQHTADFVAREGEISQLLALNTYDPVTCRLCLFSTSTINWIGRAGGTHRSQALPSGSWTVLLKAGYTYSRRSCASAAFYRKYPLVARIPHSVCVLSCSHNARTLLPQNSVARLRTTRCYLPQWCASGPNFPLSSLGTCTCLALSSILIRWCSGFGLLQTGMA